MVKAVPLFAKICALIFVFLAAILLLGPLIVVVGASLTENQFISFPPVGLSLTWYEKVLSSSEYLDSAMTSFIVAILVTVTTSVIGAAAAIAINRRQIPGAQLLAAFFLSPLVLPTIIYAIGMLMFWSSVIGPLSIPALWISHSVVALPYVVRTTLAVLTESNPFLEEAARTMGANRFQRLWLVVLPQCIPGLAAGAFFAFNISFDEAVLSLFLRTPEMTTLPVRIYGQLEFSPDPSVAAISSIMIILTIIMILIIDRLLGIRKFASA